MSTDFTQTRGYLAAADEAKATVTAELDAADLALTQMEAAVETAEFATVEAERERDEAIAAFADHMRLVHPTGPVSRILAPTKGAWFGISTEGLGIAGYKAATGIDPQVTHVYFKGTGILGGLAAALARPGVVVVNWKPTGGMGLGAYNAILAGTYNSLIDQVAVLILRAGKRFILVIDHEPENDDKVSPYASDDEYAASYRYVWDRLRVSGVKPVVQGGLVTAAWNVMGADKWMGRYSILYPGDTYVDLIAMDQYGLGLGANLEEMMQPFYDWAVAKGKKVLVNEFGLDKAAAPRAATILSAAQLKRFPEVVIWLYWDNGVDGNTYQLSQWPAGVLKTLVTDPYFHQEEPPADA